MVALQEIARRKTQVVQVGNLHIGGSNPIRVQSMTDADTADLDATYNQTVALIKAGSELVRWTVDNEDAAKQVPYIKEKLLKAGFDAPIVGDFHYNGHKLLAKYPDCAIALDKYRINPGNVGFGEKHDKQFNMIVDQAILHNKPVRIGVNWGSADQELTLKLMDDNAKLANPKPSDEIMREALIISAISSAEQAIKHGLPKDRILISCKVSKAQDLIAVYRELSKRTDICLHLGLTEAGMGSKGIVASTAALSILMQEGIGDTIRVSITPEPGAARDKEVIICQQILQTMGLRSFTPQVSSCPGCGRTTSVFFRELADRIQTHIQTQMPIWREEYPGVETLNIAVMGCIVNGPGESKHSDIGISLPGKGESPIAPVFIDGAKSQTLRGDNIVQEFKDILEDYIIKRFKKKAA